MLVTCVHVKVKAENVADFIKATEDNHRNSINEPGNFRFDICQSREDPTSFLLYEVYASQADIEAHRQTAHYARWRDAVAGWMAEPRKGVPFTLLYPAGR